MRLRSVLRFGVTTMLAAAGLAAVTGGPAPARADLIIEDPPKTKRVAVALELDWGVLADRVSRPYDVVKGDTLSSIAARLCGGKDRWKAIADANPGVVRPPDKIDTGATLWLPPLRSFDPPPAATAPADPKALAPWYDGFWLRNFERWRQGPRDRAGPDDKPSAPLADGLLIVNHSETEALLDAIRAGAVGMDHPTVAKASVLSMGVSSLAHADDPTVRIVARYRVTGLDGKTVTADLTAVRYDAKGQVVAKRMPIEGERPAPAPKEPEPAPKAPDAPPKNPAPDDDRAVHRDIPAPADSGFRWPTAAGILVALAGAVVVALLALRRRPPSKP